jgi:hypothetical protein
MGASKIMVIRHAEKPITGRADGVRARGDKDDASLIARGWQRAGALVGFFLNPTSPDIVRPEHLWAVRFDLGVEGSSRRSRQTLRPLSEMLGMECNDRFGEGQEQQLARAVVKLQGPILIAWSHGHIPKIAGAICPGVPIPDEWPDDRFDLVWVFDRQSKETTFKQVPQLLLAGDEAEVPPLVKPS